MIRRSSASRLHRKGSLQWAFVVFQVALSMRLVVGQVSFGAR